MSHFCCLVITNTKPDEDELQEILLPWHEYECTGIERYLEDIDITDRLLKEYNNSRLVVILRDGSVHDRYDNKFYIKKSDDTFRAAFQQKEFELPEGATESEMPAEEARKFGIGYKTIKECAKDNYGSAHFKDGRWYRRTNPNKKWDWWQIGGRWTGFLVPHYDPDKDPDNIETCKLCNGTGIRNDAIVQGKCNGCNGEGKHAKWPTNRKRIVGDQLQWRDVPIIALRDEAERKALKHYDIIKAVVGDRQIPVWDELRKQFEAEGKAIDDARKAYRDDPVIKDIQAIGDEYRWLDDIETYNDDRTTFAVKARRKAVVSFAVVKDGKWYERGEMGWWGFVSDKRDDWEAEYEKLLDGLPPEKWVSVVDCHI